jgi:hypothetical protein
LTAIGISCKFIEHGFAFMDSAHSAIVKKSEF